jgi:hypothetical protein
MKTTLSTCVALCLCLAASGLWVPAAMAADGAAGKLVVDGKTVELKHAYGYLDKTGNEGKDAVVILLSDIAVPPAAVQDEYARKKLVSAGTLHYVELLIVSGKQVHYEAQHQRFGYMMEPSGDDSEHVLEIKAGDGKSVAGRAHTTGAQKSVDDVPYSYDVTFAAAVEVATTR